MTAEIENETTTVRISRELHENLANSCPKKFSYGEFIEMNLELED